MKKEISVLSILLALTVLLCACAGEPEPITAPTTQPTTAPTTAPATEPTTAPTTEPTTEPATTEPNLEPTTEKVYTLADLDLSKMYISGGTAIEYYPFLYEKGQKYTVLEVILEESKEAVEERLKDFTPGFVYAWDYSMGDFICVIDEPVIAIEITRFYLFCITESNTLIVTDMTGTMKLELYVAEVPLGIQSLGYWRKSLYFIEGSDINNLDLVTGEVRKLIEYEGAIDADPLYAIDDEFPHLLCIKTATDYVACNLETGETAMIPETGQWGEEAFNAYWFFGKWPKTE